MQTQEKQELWDLYDENRNLMGRDHVRGIPLPDNCYHLAVHVWIKNSKGEYLISQRAANRLTCPLKWECVGGAVTKGENSLQGALRETKEEVGVELDPTKGRIVFSKIRKTINGKRFNDFMDVWLFDYDGEIDLKNATTDEVAQVKWMTVEEMKALRDEGKFVKSLDYFFENEAF
jgi:isopentenyldiphosphate isomerase